MFKIYLHFNLFYVSQSDCFVGDYFGVVAYFLREADPAAGRYVIQAIQSVFVAITR